jgi:ribosomal protein S18 acetylase RimI-like enzyme
MHYELRKCCEGNRAWAYALKSEAYREFVERQFGPWNEQFQRGLFDAHWNPDLSKIILVDGIPVGILATEERSDHLWVGEIQIGREWRDKGIGTTVLRALMSQAAVVRLQVLKKNIRAQSLYRRLSFSVIGETATHYVLEYRTPRLPLGKA